MTEQQFMKAQEIQDKIDQHEQSISDLAQVREGIFDYGTDEVPNLEHRVWRSISRLTADEAGTVVALIESLHEDHKRRLTQEFANL